MNVRAFLFYLSTPIQKVMQKMHPPEAQTTVALAEEIEPILKDGDILVSREKWHFTNMFIPGFFAHAAIFGRVNGSPRVVEAVAPYVQDVDFRDWVIEKHFWCILRAEGDGKKAFDWAYQQRGSGYDYQFGSRFKRGMKKLFYCSGLVYRAWKDSLSHYFRRGHSVTPEDLYQLALRSKLKVIYEHRDK